MPLRSPNDAFRLQGVVRVWQLIVLLRERSYTIPDLARRFRVSERTVRRDLWVLQRIPLPLRRSLDENEGERPPRFTLAAMAEWPRREVLPIKELPDGDHLHPV
jgi:DeoR-like protein with HTH domain